MKAFRFITMYGILAISVCCQPQSEWKIEFCEELIEVGCSNSDDTFGRNVRVYVTLEKTSTIEENMIVGNIYRMLNGKYDDYLGTNNFEIMPNTTKIHHYIPFDELGGAGPHLIEFTKSDGTLLISKELYIK